MAAAGEQFKMGSSPQEPTKLMLVLAVRLLRFTMLGVTVRQLWNGGWKKLSLPAAVSE